LLLLANPVKRSLASIKIEHCHFLELLLISKNRRPENNYFAGSGMTTFVQAFRLAKRSVCVCVSPWLNLNIFKGSQQWQI